MTTTTDHPTINGHRLRLEEEVDSPYEAIITAGQRYQIQQDTGRDVGNGTNIQDRALQDIYYATLQYLGLARRGDWESAQRELVRIQEFGSTHPQGGANYTATSIAEEFRAHNALTGDYARYPLQEFPIPPSERPAEPQVSDLTADKVISAYGAVWLAQHNVQYFKTHGQPAPDEFFLPGGSLYRPLYSRTREVIGTWCNQNRANYEHAKIRMLEAWNTAARINGDTPARDWEHLASIAPYEPRNSPLFHPFPVTFDQTRPGQEPAPMSTDTETPLPESIDGYTPDGLRELAGQWDSADDELRDVIHTLRNLEWPEELHQYGPDLHELDNIREATYAMVAHLNELADRIEKMGTIYVEVPATLRVKWDRSAPEGARAVEAYAVVHDTNGRLFHPDGHPVDEVGQCSDWCATLRNGELSAMVVRPDDVRTHRIANFN